MYYNPTTQEVKSLDVIKKELNASIPDGAESFDVYTEPVVELEQTVTNGVVKTRRVKSVSEKVLSTWYLLHEDTKPEAYEGVHVVPGPIVLRDGKYYQVYVLEPVTDNTNTVYEKDAGNDNTDNEQPISRRRVLNNLQITSQNLVFDADEDSILRMTSQIVASDNDNEIIKWVLADNSVAEISVGLLRNVLRAAKRQQTEMLTANR